MHVLIDRIVQKTELDEEQAKTAVGVILNFVSKNAGQEDMNALLEAFPAAQSFLNAEETKENSGLLGGLANRMSSSVGMLAALNELTGAGLSMSQIHTVARETVKLAKERIGDERVDQIIAKVPGLKQIA
ncbi:MULTISPECIES: DUF2780 domain-containing protein [Pseudovibrio]|uniref:DUF2780 domain-containing protein n=1 Tax=Stappiaceae TaxID=2821832 RepID=UPI002366EE36|nr:MULTISPECIES: DUF2780 domain-containing protein [Pseudovibrio]MDD7909186.1 DUF2780 domain-containing protein [Pseudovibrio exalbescens]MDX5595269.1 DUF2780 domain-containing protein [Pseudovibrio sp. SPO723]